MRLKDKIAIVTGSSSDIGLEISKKFVDEGANVVMLGRDMAKLEKARKSIKDYPLRTVAIPCDITKESQVIQTVNQITDHYGRIDILVNNAGTITDPIHFHEMTDEDCNSLVDTNLFGTFRITKSVIIKMLENKNGGSIINIGSISAERAIPKVHLTVYCTTKAAINMFTKGLAVEYARRNIRCNCVNPGIVNAGMMKSYLDYPEARKVLEDRQPINRIGEPSDIANAVAYLASDEAKWISGAILNVDGGKSASEG
ncbi:MAG: SDR family oxidoreductase [Thaumarchaeota archaeon]|nr:SDR family oxidoreductase [Nitrososphaerota archaeon]MDE1841481.1 SDR family oxidoreductase [Nitrososphaerota archaeon]